MVYDIKCTKYNFVFLNVQLGNVQMCTWEQVTVLVLTLRNNSFLEKLSLHYGKCTKKRRIIFVVKIFFSSRVLIVRNFLTRFFLYPLEIPIHSSQLPQLVKGKKIIVHR